MRIKREEVEKMSVEELASRLEALGWEADYGSIVDGVPTVFEKTLNVNDYEGVGDLMETTEELTANPDIYLTLNGYFQAWMWYIVSSNKE